MEKDKAVIIINHGTRSVVAQEDFVKLIEDIRGRFPELTIEKASMELCGPDMPSVVKELYEQGVKNITVVPFFLLRGMHIAKDIPEIISGEKNKYPDLEIVMGKPLTPDNRLVDIECDRIREALQSAENI